MAGQVYFDHMRGLALTVSITTLFCSGTVASASQKWCQSADLEPRIPEEKWYTAQDIPTDGPFMKHRDFDGSGEYQIVVGTDGRVKQCEVIKTSGLDALDQSVCANLKRRARFNILTDPSCSDVMRANNYMLRFRWSMDSDEEPLARVQPG
jgi:Gram-negative bacterial TonB protein C-terminal